MTQPPLRVAIYARFSTDKQRDASIEDQVDSCRELAAREGWEVVATYHDRATSGASMFRPGIEALQRDAKAGRFEIVLAEAMDRLSRKLADIAKFHERMDHQGIEIHTLTEGKVDAMLIGMKGTMNQILLRDIGIKTHRGQKGRVRAGKLAGGNAYGYDVLPGISVNGKLEHGDRAVNRIEAEVVRRIFEDYAQGISAGKIAEALDLANATLSFHLKTLTQAGLIEARQDGRFIHCSANFAAMNSLLGFLSENCCGGKACC